MSALGGGLALVTGASAGIGRALALELASRGMRVVGVGRDAARLAALVEEARARGLDVTSRRADLAVPEAVDALCEELRVSAGTPDLVVNNAGAGSFRFLDEVTPEEARRMLEVPFLSYVRVTQRFLRPMLERGTGRLAFVNSGACYLPFPGATGYVSSRFAVRGFFEALRADLHGTGVRPSMHIPWIVRSDYFETNERSMERLPVVARLVPAMSCEAAAARIARALESGRAFHIFPPVARLLCATGHHFPAFARWLSRLTGHARTDAIAPPRRLGTR